MFEEEKPDLRSANVSPPASPPAGSYCHQTLPQPEEVVSSVADIRTVQRPTAPTGAPPTVPSAVRPAAPPAAPLRTPPAPRRKRVLPAWMLTAAAGSASSVTKGADGIPLVLDWSFSPGSPGVLLMFYLLVIGLYYYTVILLFLLLGNTGVSLVFYWY